MAQEQIHLPELNDRITKKLRVQDSFAADGVNQASLEEEEEEEEEEDEQYEDVNTDNDANNSTSNNNNTNTNEPNTNVYKTIIYPKSNNTTSNHFVNNIVNGGEQEEKEEKGEDDDDDQIDFGVLIAEFSQLTGEDDQGRILAVLEKHNWKLEAAVSSFLDEQDSRYYYQPTHNPSPYHTTSTSTSTSTYSNSNNNNNTTTSTNDYDNTTTGYTNYDSYKNRSPADYNSRDQHGTLGQLPRGGASVLPKTGYDDDSDENDNDDEASMYANPDTRHDVSDDSDDETYLKSLGFPSTNTNINERQYQTTASTSTTKYDQNDYVAFRDTLDDHIENNSNNNNNNNKEKQAQIREKSTISHDDDPQEDNYYSNSNNNNNYTTSDNNYTHENDNNNNNNNNNSDTFNNYRNPHTTPTFEPKYEKGIPGISYTQDLGYNTKYFCKLGVPGSGWTHTTPVVRGRSSLKLLCVDQMTGLVVTHERLIELLHLCESIDCYAFHQLIFGTASRCYYTIRTLPSYLSLSDATQSRIRDFMTDSWDD